MSAPTVWEEGRISGDRVTRLAALSCLLLVVVDVGLTRRLGLLFDLGFVLVCVVGAFAVHPRDFFRVGVLPPMLMATVCLALALGFHDAIARPADGIVQSLLSGLAQHAASLGIGYALTLAVLAIRLRVRAGRLGRRAAPAQEIANLPTSPAPTRVTSATPEEKSTTVVGDEPHSPESITASSS